VAVKPENKVFMLFNFLNSQLLTFFSPFGADALSPSPTRFTYAPAKGCVPFKAGATLPDRRVSSFGEMLAVVKKFRFSVSEHKCPLLYI